MLHKSFLMIAMMLVFSNAGTASATTAPNLTSDPTPLAPDHRHHSEPDPDPTSDPTSNPDHRPAAPVTPTTPVTTPLPTWEEWLGKPENCAQAGAEMYRKLSALTSDQIKTKMSNGKKMGFDFLGYQPLLLGGLNTQLVINKQCSLPESDADLPGLLRIGGGAKKYYTPPYVEWFGVFMKAYEADLRAKRIIQ